MAKDVEAHVLAIESTMRQMVVLHEELLPVMIRKREAVRRAHVDLMAELCRLENEKVQGIAELEKQRQALVARLTLLIDPKSTEPMRLIDLATRIAEPWRGRLLVTRQQLVEKLESVKEQTAVARRAADQLVKHVQGLVQGVTSAATAATYTKPSAGPRPAARLSTFSMTA